MIDSPLFTAVVSLIIQRWIMEAFIILTRESLSNVFTTHEGSDTRIFFPRYPNTNEQTDGMLCTCKDKMTLHFLLRIPLDKMDKFTEKTRGK